jgi:hypothetical protein
VEVDEPRSDQQPVGVDLLVGRLVKGTDGHDPAGPDADISAPGRLARAIDHGPRSNHQIQHVVASSR